uniref:Uncharacterized protein n=1 Tax=Megaselia scalaris TaxID=36166 RepID=T1H2R8_MEGSC
MTQGQRKAHEIQNASQNIDLESPRISAANSSLHIDNNFSLENNQQGNSSLEDGMEIPMGSNQSPTNAHSPL